MTEFSTPGPESENTPERQWRVPEEENGIRTKRDLHERLPDGSTIADALDAKYPRGWRFVEDDPMTEQAESVQARQGKQADQLGLNIIAGTSNENRVNIEHGGVVVPWGHIEVAIPSPDEEQDQ